ncbi:MAG: amino acid permease [Candidatus Aenigmatarchaeota archaeon]
MKTAKTRGRGKPGLKREIGFWEATIYGVGIILGAGVYALIGEAAGMAGNSVWMSFAMAALVGLLTGLSYMELISMFPKAAAEYVYVKNAFKSRLLAFDVGWIAIFASVIATAAVALGFAGYLHELVGAPVVLSAIALISVMSVVNFWGIRETTRLNTVFSLVEVAGLVFVVLLALFFGHYGSVDYFEMPNGVSGVMSGAALIFFAYIGFEDIANISEEAKNPRKVLPKALIAAVAITTVLYVLVGMAVVSLVGWEDLAASKAPLALAVSSVLGGNAFWLMSVIALFATANTVLLGLVVGSRMMYGMARDGSLPGVLSRVHKKRFTPWVSLSVSMALAVAFVFIGQIKVVASVTDMCMLCIFMFVNASVILLRYSMPNAKREFRTPLNIGKFPVLPLMGMVAAAALLLHLSPESLMIGAAVAVSGVVAYKMQTHKKLM